MTIFPNRNLGFNPRKAPTRARISALLVGAASFALSFAALLLLAPFRGDLNVAHSIFAAPFPYGLVEPDIGKDALWIRFGTSLAIGVTAGWRVYACAWRDTPETEPFVQPNRADPAIHRGEAAERELKRVLISEAGRDFERGLFIAPHIALPRQHEQRNILIQASSGSGKSNICRALAQQAIERGDFVVLHCTKGDVTRAFRMKDIILISPAHRDGWAWDIGADVDGPAAAAEFAAAIVPASQPPFWSDTARLVLTDVILTLIAERGRNWGARDLLAAVLEAPNAIRERISRIDLSAACLLAGDDAEPSKTTESVLATLVSGALKTLRPMAYSWSGTPADKRISIKHALSTGWKGPRILILQSHSDFELLSTAVCGGVLRRLCQAIAAPGSGQHRPTVTMVLDEFFSLGRIEGIERSLSVAREHNMSTIAAVQSVWQLRSLYGDAAELLADMFQIKIYGRHVAGEAVERAVRDLGSRRIVGRKLNTGSDPKDTRTVVPFEQDLAILTPTQLERDLGLFDPRTPRERVSALLRYAGGNYLIDWPPTRWTAQSEGFVPADWTKRPLLKMTGEPNQTS